MKEIITEAAKREIEEIANGGHADAIKQFGADMYHNGYRRGGMIGGALSLITGIASSTFFWTQRYGRRIRRYEERSRYLESKQIDFEDELDEIKKSNVKVRAEEDDDEDDEED